MRQQALGALRLREGDDVTDGVRFAHHRDDAVETEGEAAVRRSTELEGVEQEAELLTGFFRTDLEGFEDLFLDFFAVDTDGAAADFPTVEDHVVGLGVGMFRIGDEEVLMTVERAGERMVAGNPALVFFRVLEHREVDDPERLPARGEEAVRLAEFGVTDLQAESAEAVPDDLGLVGAEEHDVAVLGAGAFDDRVELFIGEVLDDRALETFAALGEIVDLDVGETLGTVDLDELGVGVDFGTRHGGGARNAQGDDLAVVQGLDAGEHLERGVLDDVGHFDELQVDAKVGLVGAVLGHGVVPVHDGERVLEVDVEDFLEDRADEFFHQGADFVHVEEGRFNIDLREFRLTVGAKVFVAEALDDLIVAVEAGDHQELLEELRRLRQGEETAVLNAGRNEVVAGAFRRGARQHRGFDVDEAVLVEELAEGHGSAIARAEVLLHDTAAKVEHAVRQTRGFGEVFVIEVERRRDRRVEDLEFMAENFDAAGDERFVLRAFRTGAHDADDPETEFVAALVGRGEDFGTVRVADDLNDALAVAKVDEDHAAVVATTMSPAEKSHGLTDEGFINQARIYGSHISSEKKTNARYESCWPHDYNDNAMALQSRNGACGGATGAPLRNQFAPPQGGESAQ